MSTLINAVYYDKSLSVIVAMFRENLVVELIQCQKQP